MLRATRAGLSPYAKQTTVARTAEVACAVAVLALSIVSIGLPGTLVLAGGWALAATLHRTVPGLQGPVSWAAGAIVELSLVTLGSAVLAAASPHEHGRRSTLALLAMPLVVAAGGFVVQRLRGRLIPGPDATPARPLLAAAITAAGLILPLRVASHGVDYRVAWAASGDARNHVLIIRQILHAGGITTSELRGYPAVIDNLSGLLTAAGGRGGRLPGQLMVHDAHALATTYVVTGIALALTIVAALLELLPPTMANLRRLPAATTLAVLASTLLATSAVVLHTSLLDGYVSAYGSIFLVVAAAALALRTCASSSWSTFLLLGPAAVLVFFSWTVLAVVPIAFVIAAAAVVAVRHRVWTLRGASRPAMRDALPWLAAVVVSVGACLALAGVTLTHVDLLHQQFKTSGSITSPQPRLLWMLVFLGAALVAAAPSPRWRRQLVVPLVSAVVGVATVRFLRWLSPDGTTPTYYSVKTLYLIGASTLWVVFAPLVLVVSTWTPAAGQRVTSAVRAVGSAAAGLALIALVGWASPLPNPVTKAEAGWNQPSAGIITETARWADKGQPFVLWHWSDPGNERLGDFWAALTWAYDAAQVPKPYGPTVPGGVGNWGYIEGSGMHDICLLIEGVNGIYVVTHEPGLKAAINRQCPNHGEHVVVEK